MSAPRTVMTALLAIVIGACGSMPPPAPPSPASLHRQRTPVRTPAMAGPTATVSPSATRRSPSVTHRRLEFGATGHQVLPGSSTVAPLDEHESPRGRMSTGASSTRPIRSCAGVPSVVRSGTGWRSLVLGAGIGDTINRVPPRRRHSARRSGSWRRLDLASSAPSLRSGDDQLGWWSCRVDLGTLPGL